MIFEFDSGFKNIPTETQTLGKSIIWTWIQFEILYSKAGYKRHGI